MSVALHPELAAALTEGGSLRHRFVNEPFYAARIKQLPETNQVFNDTYDWKMKETEAAFESGDWHIFVFLHERPWRVDALQDALWNGGFRHTAPLISEVWRDSENIRECLGD